MPRARTGFDVSACGNHCRLTQLKHGRLHFPRRAAYKTNGSDSLNLPEMAERSRFAAPYAQRSELKASVNNAVLGIASHDPQQAQIRPIGARDRE